MAIGSDRAEEVRAGFERIHARQRETGASPIPLHIRRIALSYGRVADATLRADAGVSLARFMILAALEASDGIPGALLADLTGQRPQSLADAVGCLERDGLLERRSGRGRERLHFLTPAGTAALDSARATLAFVHERVLEGLDADARARLESDLGRVIASIDALEAERALPSGDRDEP